MNRKQAIALTAALALSPLSLLPAATIAHAATPIDNQGHPSVIALSDLPDALGTHNGTDYPTCWQEDCSDQPNQTGLWLDEDTGNWYLEMGPEVIYLVIDDTVTK